MAILLSAVAFGAAVVLALGGVVQAYLFERDSLRFAERHCPAPPNGVDSTPYSTCFAIYEDKSGADIARPFFVAAAALAVASGAVLIVSFKSKRGAG